MTDKQNFCLNCIFWKTENKTTNWGKCRRYPPQFWSNGDDSGSDFVKTNGDDWCGEHKPHEVWILPKGWRIKEMPNGPGGLCEVQDKS